MNRFWNSIIFPIIQGVNAKYIVEIGSDTGLNTEKILEYCIDNDAHMVAIDPFPQFDVEEFKSKYGDKFKIYKDLSLNKLPILKDYDVILIDGDHNWYTVYNELKIIEKTFNDHNFPLVFLHDVGWPYGRRDLYYNPEDIPADYRQPYKKLGMNPANKDLEKKAGLNSSLYNALHENGPKNGVLTAIEDFIEESNQNFYFKIIDSFHGLGILFPKNPEIENVVKNVDKSNLFKKIEDERIKFAVENKRLLVEKNDQTQKLTRIKGLLKEKENIIVNLEKKVITLKSEINCHKNSILEIKYLNNVDRPINQRLISIFPSLYIFLKHKNHIKTALINLKGYKSIKKNNLIDLGYYLKNNDDVRKSGMDPILHYIYHGYEEGRNPKPNFDGKYYLKKYKDVEKSGINPLIHYSVYGKKEKRKNPFKKNILSNETIYNTLSKHNFITDPLIKLSYLELTSSIYNSNYLRVGVFIEGHVKNLKPCPYIRLYSPLKHLSSKEKFKIFIYGTDDLKKIEKKKILKSKLFDVIIIQRGATDFKTGQLFLKRCRDNDIKVIYELDDDLLSIGENNVCYNFYKKRSDNTNNLIKNSDLVTVSTEGLLERFNDVNKTVIIRNYLVNELNPMQKIELKNNKIIKIGYYGTHTHDDDLLMIKEPINRIIKKFKENYGIDIEFHIIGGMIKKHDESWFTKVEIPNDSKDFISFMNWIKNNVKYDIMVAPLIDTLFNKSKSEIKYIEYTALGIPGIYSDLKPYNSVIENGVNGLLAKNINDWELKLERLILDQKLRIKIVENAQEHINKNYLLKHRSEEWGKILKGIVTYCD